MTPMAGAKQAVSQLVVPTRSLCRSADPVADIVWYPCMDMNSASYVRNTVDALPHLAVPMAEITVLRCARFGMSQQLLCIPSFVHFLLSESRVWGRYWIIGLISFTWSCRGMVADLLWRIQDPLNY